MEKWNKNSTIVSFSSMCATFFRLSHHVTKFQCYPSHPFFISCTTTGTWHLSKHMVFKCTACNHLQFFHCTQIHFPRRQTRHRRWRSFFFRLFWRRRRRRWRRGGGRGRGWGRRKRSGRRGWKWILFGSSCTTHDRRQCNTRLLLSLMLGCRLKMLIDFKLHTSRSKKNSLLVWVNLQVSQVTTGVTGETHKSLFKFTRGTRQLYQRL